jgi:hypothetical protein
MGVGIAKINALPAVFPAHPPLNLHAVDHQMPFPVRQLLFRHRQPDMRRPHAIVRRNKPGRVVRPTQRITFDKQQQNASIADVVGAKPFVGGHRRQLQHLPVKRVRAFNIADVQHRFYHPVDFEFHNSLRSVFHSDSVGRTEASQSASRADNGSIRAL